MKRLFSYLLLFLCITSIMASCKKHDDDGGNADALVDPANANALAGVVVTPSGTTVRNGSMPAPTGGVGTPHITAQITNVLTSNGSTALFYYSYSNVVANLAGFYVQIEGAGSYFTIPYSGSAGASGQINLPLGLPANVAGGNFCLLFSVYDGAGHVSNQVKVCAEVLRLGTGSLQISLSWNTATDQDLWVTDPSNTKIYYFNKTSSTGGRLDRDDVDGFGPENIFWLTNAPDGTYNVQVNDYDNTSSPNTCYVTISSPGKSKSFNVTTQRGSTATVATIRKSGTSYEY